MKSLKKLEIVQHFRAFWFYFIPHLRSFYTAPSGISEFTNLLYILPVMFWLSVKRLEKLAKKFNTLHQSRQQIPVQQKIAVPFRCWVCFRLRIGFLQIPLKYCTIPIGWCQWCGGGRGLLLYSTTTCKLPVGNQNGVAVKVVFRNSVTTVPADTVSSSSRVRRFCQWVVVLQISKTGHNAWVETVSPQSITCGRGLRSTGTWYTLSTKCNWNPLGESIHLMLRQLFVRCVPYMGLGRLVYEAALLPGDLL